MDFDFKSSWDRIPEQLKRLLSLLAVLIVLYVVVRSLLVPDDFGKYGHFRASAVDEIVSQELKYAGRDVCVDCHDEVVGEKNRVTIGTSPVRFVMARRLGT